MKSESFCGSASEVHGVCSGPRSVLHPRFLWICLVFFSVTWLTNHETNEATREPLTLTVTTNTSDDLMHNEAGAVSWQRKVTVSNIRVRGPDGTGERAEGKWALFCKERTVTCCILCSCKEGAPLETLPEANQRTTTSGCVIFFVVASCMEFF